MLKKLLIILVLFVLAGAGWYFLKNKKVEQAPVSQPSAPASQPAMPFKLSDDASAYMNALSKRDASECAKISDSALKQRCETRVSQALAGTTTE